MFDKINLSIEENILAFALRIIRNYKKLTQKQVGELLGKKEATIRGYENNRLKITKELLFLLVRRLKMSKFEFDDAIIINRISRDTMDNKIENKIFKDLSDFLFPKDIDSKEKDFFSEYNYNLFSENMKFWLTILLRTELGEEFYYNEESFHTEIYNTSNSICEFVKREIERIKYPQK